jgi:hypothetical protein
MASFWCAYSGFEFHTFYMVGEKTEENETEYCLSLKRTCKRRKKAVKSWHQISKNTHYYLTLCSLQGMFHI